MRMVNDRLDAIERTLGEVVKRLATTASSEQTTKAGKLDELEWAILMLEDLKQETMDIHAAISNVHTIRW